MEFRDVCTGIWMWMLWLCTTPCKNGAEASAEHLAMHFHPLCLSLPTEKKNNYRGCLQARLGLMQFNNLQVQERMQSQLCHLSLVLLLPALFNWMLDPRWGQERDEILPGGCPLLLASRALPCAKHCFGVCCFLCLIFCKCQRWSSKNGDTLTKNLCDPCILPLLPSLPTPTAFSAKESQFLHHSRLFANLLLFILHCFSIQCKQLLKQNGFLQWNLGCAVWKQCQMVLSKSSDLPGCQSTAGGGTANQTWNAVACPLDPSSVLLQWVCSKPRERDGERKWGERGCKFQLRSQIGLSVWGLCTGQFWASRDTWDLGTCGQVGWFCKVKEREKSSKRVFPCILVLVNIC